jgi:hypothetical protein
MSCGERSCIHYGKCPRKDDSRMNGYNPNCNVDCVDYVGDPAIKPDSRPGQSVCVICSNDCCSRCLHWHGNTEMLCDQGYCDVTGSRVTGCNDGDCQRFYGEDDYLIEQQRLKQEDV